ncbi:MAG: GatB/YqeY domain-containing protein [Candidatus Saccharimonadales bacterium]
MKRCEKSILADKALSLVDRSTEGNKHIMQDKINKDLNQALKDGDSSKVSVLRLIRSSLGNVRIDKGKELSDDDVMVVLQKEAKQRKDSIDSYKSADRQDLADKEEAELKIIESYLPKPLSDKELEKLIDEAITELGVSDIKGMGQVMGQLKGKVGARADGAHLSQLVRNKLS